MSSAWVEVYKAQSTLSIGDTAERREVLASQLNCLTCGACCDTTFWGIGAEPFQDPKYVKPSKEVSCGSAMRTCRGSCKALRSAKGTFTCKVYADRPTICREFAVGGALCLLARANARFARDLPFVENEPDWRDSPYDVRDDKTDSLQDLSVEAGG